MADVKTQVEAKYDVAIIGSGPAGASAAKALAGHGLKNVIVEKAKLPRYKMCSGVLSPTSVKFVSDHFGKIPDHVVAEPLDVLGARVYPAIGSPFVDIRFSEVDKGPGNPEVGISVKRAEFDHWLATDTETEIIEECRFSGFEIIDSELVLKLKQKASDRMIAAKYIVGADGVLSRVRNTISPEFDKGLRMIPNYEEWYLGEIDLESGWLNVFLDERVTTFFASIFHKDGKIVVVTGAKQPGPVKQYFQTLIDYLKKDYGLVIKEKLANYACIVHDMAATNNFHLGEGNILLVGEAGGFSRVLDEGISSALITGKAAAEAILKSIETGQPAFQYYREKAAPEAELSTSLNRMLNENFGLNPFTR